MICDMSKLQEYAERQPWAGRYQAIFETHFDQALVGLGIDLNELDDVLDGQWRGIIRVCAFEDFASCNFGPDNVNIIDEYLKRRGFDETDDAKLHMRELSNSVMSLYEVISVIPGTSFIARDLIRDGEPIMVNEMMGTKKLEPMDRIAARVLTVKGVNRLGGGMLRLSPDSARKILSSLAKRLAWREKGAPEAQDITLLFGDVPALFSGAWQKDFYQYAIDLTVPEIVNTDGDTIVLHSLHFPLASGVTQKAVAAQLDQADDLHRWRAKHWDWLRRAEDGPLADKEDAYAMSDPVTVLGNIDIDGRTLILAVNSQRRAQAGRAMIERALGALVGDPRIVTSTHSESVDEFGDQVHTGIPTGDATEMTSGWFDHHYRQILDQPIGMLGDQTPRAAVKTLLGKALTV
ncbi:MAG: hypothetical protein RL367_1219, partial [Pseudomonadota bacterium]